MCWFQSGGGQCLGPFPLSLSPMGFIQAPGELARPWSLTILLGSHAFRSKRSFFHARRWGLRGWAAVGLSRKERVHGSFDRAPLPQPGLSSHLGDRWVVVAGRLAFHCVKVVSLWPCDPVTTSVIAGGVCYYL